MRAALESEALLAFLGASSSSVLVRSQHSQLPVVSAPQKYSLEEQQQVLACKQPHLLHHHQNHRTHLLNHQQTSIFLLVQQPKVEEYELKSAAEPEQVCAKFPQVHGSLEEEHTRVLEHVQVLVKQLVVQGVIAYL